MSDNFDASQVGVPYLRAHKITIYYPDNGALPFTEIEQSLAVKLADGTVRKLQNSRTLNCVFDLAANGNNPIPLVNPDNGQPLAGTPLVAALGSLTASGATCLNLTMLNILAVVRAEQRRLTSL